MGTFGCHNCGKDLSKYKDKPWDQCPCATCPLGREYTRTFSTGYFETPESEENGEGYTMDLPEEHQFVTTGSFPLEPEEIQSLETMKKAISDQISTMFSGILVRLLHMAKVNPVMFEVFIKKLQFPYMSYAEIGDTMDPKCSKQNVLYHLKSVVEQFPELEAIIQTDTRYSGGRYALKTIADKRKQEIAEERIQRNIYGKDYNLFRYPDMKELNAILHLPFNIRDEVFTFNPYVKDEEHVNGTSED